MLGPIELRPNELGPMKGDPSTLAPKAESEVPVEVVTAKIVKYNTI